MASLRLLTAGRRSGNWIFAQVGPRKGVILFVVWLLLAARAGGDTLYFIATPDSTGKVNESWFSANNWYYPGGLGTFIPANRIPLSTDDAILTTSPVLCAANSISVNTLTLRGVTVVGGDFSVLNLNTFPVAGSTPPTFSGSSVKVQNEHHLSVGPFDGTTIFTASTLIVDSGAFVLIDPGATLNMAGRSTLYDIGQVVLTGGSTLLFTGGTNQFSILPSAVLSGSGTTSVVNGGGAGALLFDNNGQVRGDAGFMTLALGGAIWTNSLGLGEYAASVSNATLEFVGGYALHAGNTNQFFGPGLIWFFGGITTATNNGVFRVGDPDPVPGTVRWDGTLFGTGEVDVLGSPGLPSVFLWDGGTINGPQVVNVDGWSQLVLTNASTKTLAGATINNAGLATWVTDSGRFALDNGAVFNNLATAIFSVENDAILEGGAGTGLSVFNNAGVFRKVKSANTTQFLQDAFPKPGPAFINTGLLDVQSGRLWLLGGTNFNRINIAAAARLEFNANYTQAPGTSFSGGGTGIVDQVFWLNADVAIPNLDVSGSGTVAGPGHLTITSTLSVNDNGVIQSPGALFISSNATFNVPSGMSLSRNVYNRGTANVGSAASIGTLVAGTNLLWNNEPGGVLALFEGATLAANFSGPPPVLNNAGTLENALPNTAATVNWICTNSGIVSISSTGQLMFARGFTQVAGSTVVPYRGTLAIGGSPNATALILGGTLSGVGGVSGNLLNYGTVHPGGSPGVLTINGVFTNGNTGILAVEIDGTSPGTQFSQLNNGGAAGWLGGRLQVTFGNGFLPALGETFKIYSNGVPHDTFASLAGVHGGNGIVLVPLYHAGDVSLVAANDPTLMSLARNGSTYSFSYQSTAGLTNLIEFTDSLNAANWQTLTTIIGDGTLKSVVDPTASIAERFYRIRFQ